MAFHEEWYDEAKLERLRQEMACADSADGSVVEVGAWEGRSTIAIAQHFAPQTVHVIDHWKGDPSMPSCFQVEALARDVYADFKENLQAAGVTNVAVIRSDWRQVNWQAFEPIRFLHIDADHRYAEVHDNILQALPLMAVGGVICGDDYNWPEVRAAAIHLLGEGIRIGPPNHAVWGWTR